MPTTFASIKVFNTHNPVYAYATVTFYTADANGLKTSTKATIYSDVAATVVADNPQTLDAFGKLQVPLYHLVDIIAEVQGIGIAQHDTALMRPFSSAAGSIPDPSLGATGDLLVNSAGANILWETAAFQAFSAGDATPSVAGGRQFRTANTAPTTITALDAGYDGQRVVILINDAFTTIDFSGTTLKGNGGIDWTPASGDHMVCTFDGTNWYCTISENSGQGFVAFADQDATPDVSGGEKFKTANTLATTITAFDGGYDGQEIIVVFGDALTTIDFTATTLKGNVGADWTPALNDHMLCVFDGTNWFCNISDNTV